jgi:hypothetical protein
MFGCPRQMSNKKFTHGVERAAGMAVATFSLKETQEELSAAPKPVAGAADR